MSVAVGAAFREVRQGGTTFGSFVTAQVRVGQRQLEDAHSLKKVQGRDHS